MFCITLLSSIVAEMVTRGTVINSKGCLVSIIQGVQLIVSETKAILYYIRKPLIGENMDIEP